MTYQYKRRYQLFVVIALIVAMMLSIFTAGTAFSEAGSQVQAFGPVGAGADPTLTFDQIQCQTDFFLEYVQFDVTVNADNAELILDNDSVNPKSPEVTLGAQVNLQSTDVDLLNHGGQPVVFDVIAQSVQSFSLDPNIGDGPGDFDPSPPDGTTMLGGNPSGNQSGYIDIAYHSQYEGTGTFDVDVIIEDILKMARVRGVETLVTPADVDGTVTMNWNCTSPAAVTLQSSGVAGNTNGQSYALVGSLLISVMTAGYFILTRRESRA